MDHDVDGVGIVAQALLDEAGEGGPHEGPVEPELVHQLESRARLAVGGRRLDGLAHDLAAALAFLVADLEVLLLGARRGDASEGRVGDVVADATLHGDLGAAPDFDVIDESGVGRGQELGQRVLRLVHVVVRVEDGKIELSRRHQGPLVKVTLLLDDYRLRRSIGRRVRGAACSWN